MSIHTALSVRFMPGRDISLRSFVRDLLFTMAYGPAVLFPTMYLSDRFHGVWYVVFMLGLVGLHVLLTTDFLITGDEAERLTGYSIERRRDAIWFRGYAPGRRHLRYVGMPIKSVDELDSEVQVLLRDDSRVRLPRLNPEGQRLFREVFESLNSGAGADVLRKECSSLREIAFGGFAYKEAPQLPKWRYAITFLLMLLELYVVWKLYQLVFR